MNFREGKTRSQVKDLSNPSPRPPPPPVARPKGCIAPAGGCYWIHAADWNRIVLDMPLGDDRGAKGYQEALDDVTRALCTLPKRATGGELRERMDKLAERWEKIAERTGVRTFTGNDHLIFANELRAAIAAPQDGEADHQ